MSTEVEATDADEAAQPAADPIDLEKELPRLIDQVAPYQAMRYRPHVEEGEIRNELWVYALDPGKDGGRRQHKRWAARGERRRIRDDLAGFAKHFCEAQKAAALGYDPADVAWYTPELLSALVPTALDFEFDGLTGESGDESRKRKQTNGRESGSMLAMVMDCRLALERTGMTDLTADMFNPEDVLGRIRLERLAEALGGEFPDSPGYRRGPRRRAMSNAKAAAEIRKLTENTSEEW